MTKQVSIRAGSTYNRARSLNRGRGIRDHQIREVIENCRNGEPVEIFKEIKSWRDHHEDKVFP